MPSSEGVTLVSTDRLVEGQPRPHPDVVNVQPSVLIVGYGHVGRQIARYFTGADYVTEEGRRMRVADGCLSTRILRAYHDDESPDGRLVYHGGEYDLGFLCVPTPEGEGGRCDTSVVREAFAQWGGAARYWCVKSTVEPGTTASLGPNVCMSPEYYGETLHHPFSEKAGETFVVLGGPPAVTAAFAEAWTLVTHSGSLLYQTDSLTAELTKLMENAWIATKVTFVNEFRLLAEAAGVDWHTLRELWLADPRVGRSHTYAYQANRGYSGKCLPKDTSNLCHWARQLGQPAELIEAVREVNSKLRSRYQK